MIVITAIGILFVIFAAFVVWVFWDYNLRQNRAQELESRFGMNQVWRAGEKYRLIRQIGSPECPDGRYSPNQMALWEKYKQLDQQDVAETAWEQNLIVETKGYS